MAAGRHEKRCSWEPPIVDGKETPKVFAKDHMHRTEEKPMSSRSLEPVVLWAMNRLRDAGFAPELAETVARDAANDLARILDVAAILELVDRGCPPELAVRILDPVDESAVG